MDVMRPGHPLLPLHPHEGNDAAAVRAGCALAQDQLALRFACRSPLPMAPPGPPVRTDGLWRSTCFELFLRGAGEPYVEWNFAPSGAWAAYRFAARRTAMRDLPTVPPAIAWQADGDAAALTAAVPLAAIAAHIGPPPWQANLTAVIEAVDGSIAHHALAHPHGPPDFHDPACFVLTIG